MRLATILVALLVAVSADAGEWRTGWDGTLYGYGSRTLLNGDSLLNPGNRVARLQESGATAELRLNLKAANEWLRLDARPILFIRDERNALDSQQTNDLYVSRWQARLRLGETWSMSGGREVMNWGPAQFRSPSSPFYFDSGRSDPMRELTGMDMAKLVWTPTMNTSATAAWIVQNGDKAVVTDGWKKSWLAKFDRRGEQWVYALIVARAEKQTPYYGGYVQFTPDDAWMLYGEASWAALAGVDNSPRRATALAGMAYTFENGQTLNVEYLHDGHGFSRSERDTWLQQAAVVPGAALAGMPRLVGRDYLHLVWQSNLMDSAGYWRLMATHNLSDHGSSLAGYGELALAGRYSLFATGYWNFGNARQESAALIRGAVTAGIKVAMP